MCKCKFLVIVSLVLLGLFAQLCVEVQSVLFFETEKKEEAFKSERFEIKEYSRVSYLLADISLNVLLRPRHSIHCFRTASSGDKPLYFSGFSALFFNHSPPLFFQS